MLEHELCESPEQAFDACNKCLDDCFLAAAAFLSLLSSAAASLDESGTLAAGTSRVCFKRCLGPPSLSIPSTCSSSWVSERAPASWLRAHAAWSAEATAIKRSPRRAKLLSGCCCLNGRDGGGLSIVYVCVCVVKERERPPRKRGRERKASKRRTAGGSAEKKLCGHP